MRHPIRNQGPGRVRSSGSVGGLRPKAAGSALASATMLKADYNRPKTGASKTHRPQWAFPPRRGFLHANARVLGRRGPELGSPHAGGGLRVDHQARVQKHHAERVREAYKIPTHYYVFFLHRLTHESLRCSRWLDPTPRIYDCCDDCCIAQKLHESYIYTAARTQHDKRTRSRLNCNQYQQHISTAPLRREGLRETDQMTDIRRCQSHRP